MTSKIYKDGLEWPKEQAERVKFFLPKDCDPYQEKSQSKQRTCVFRYYEDRHLLAVVFDDDTEGIALDLIDPKDVIGVNVEIKLTGPESVTSFARDHNNGVVSHIHEQDRSSATNIKTSEEHIKISEVPIDNKAVAVLSIFVYPRRKTGIKESILRFCGVGRNDSKTSKTRTICDEGMAQHRDNSDAGNFECFGHRHGQHRKFTVAPAEDFTDLSVMMNAIRKLSRSNPSLETEGTSQDEERILVIVNPYSGKRMGVHTYDTALRPMLEQAGIAYDCLITTHAKHAEERMKKQCSTSDFRDISEYTGIVLVGGDGIIHEVMQGIHRRVDRDKIQERVKLGVIGAGTANGFSASLAYASKENHSPLDSAFMIVKDVSSLVDLSRYETKSTSYTSFLTFSWAMIADIDIESECIRWAGFLRMDIWGVVRVLFLRKYRAKFSYLPPDKEHVKDLPLLSEPISDLKDWVTCEDDFILFWASQVTHAGEHMFNAPPCRLDDGVFHIMVVRGNISRVRLALILLSMEHGGHVGMKGVELIECCAYRLEPITEGSFNDLDGEVIESGSIQATILPLSLQVYCNPQYV